MIALATGPLRRAGLALLSTLGIAVFAACSSGETTTGTGGSSSSTTSSSATGTGGSAGGEGGGPSVPPLDPAACDGVPDSEGADPMIAAAAAAQWSPSYVPPASNSIVQDKAFFLATLLQLDTAAAAALAADPTLAAVSADRDARVRSAPSTCGDDVACHVDAVAWTDADAAVAADALVGTLMATGSLSTFAQDAMRASGRFSLHADLDDGALVKAAFIDLIAALGQTLGDEAAALGGAKLADAVTSATAAHPAAFAFFEPLLAVTLAALAADGRDEAARYEPLAAGENAKALAHIPSIDWAQYPFTAILVPGQGPSDPNVVLDPNGQARVDLAAQRFAKGLAPLIALSGGHVHPDRTPYSEAIEMKKYLLATYDVPEEAVIIDPHARHTTTNLRNVSRLLLRYGVPANRALLVTSDFGQSLYIGFWHGTFGPRCEDELGYRPWRALIPISSNDSCMIPVAVSLHADGRDALDP
ncbi:Hypothetical protein A7982_04564 [Minicystis rosea]|nr:Hypothetical protein A7982_04564 [Minicystis rosea]